MDGAPTGLRERGKQDRLRRLRAAALEVFRARGYDAATVREIAGLAEVSVGTVFGYAHDKRDLLFLVVNDDLDEVLRGGLLASAEPGAPLDRLAALLGPIYDYFAREPALSRPVLREVVHYERAAAEIGEQARRYLLRMEAWQGGIAAVLDDAARAGQLALDAPAEVLARIVWAIHLVEVRRWRNAETPDAGTGRAQIMGLIGVVLAPRLRAGNSPPLAVRDVEAGGAAGQPSVTAPAPVRRRGAGRGT